jgi:hypothetical protein
VVTTPIYISGLPGEDKPSEIGNLSFNNVTVEGNYDLSVVFTELLNEDANLNNISGAISVFNNGDGEASRLDTEPLAQNLTLNVLELTGWRSTDEGVSVYVPSSNNDWVEISSDPEGSFTQDLTGEIESVNSYQFSATDQPENSEIFAVNGTSYNNEINQLQEFDSGDFAG